MVCNKCGAAAENDSRGDSTNWILRCGCDKKGRSYIDTRGGSAERIYLNDARPVEDNDFYDEDWANFGNR